MCGHYSVLHHYTHYIFTYTVFNAVTVIVWIFKDLAGDQQCHLSSWDGLDPAPNSSQSNSETNTGVHYFKSHSTSYDIISQQNNSNAVIPLVHNVIITNTRNCRATQTADYRNARAQLFVFLCFGVIHHSCDLNSPCLSKEAITRYAFQNKRMLPLCQHPSAVIWPPTSSPLKNYGLDYLRVI